MTPKKYNPLDTAQAAVSHPGVVSENFLKLATAYLDLDAKGRALRDAAHRLHVQLHLDAKSMTESETCREYAIREREVREKLKAFDAETPTGGGGDES